MTILYYAAIALVALILWWVIGFFAYKKTLTDKAIAFKKRMEKVAEIEEELLNKEKEQAQKIIELSEKKCEKMEEKKQTQLESIEERILKREEKIDEKLLNLEEQKETMKKKVVEIEIIKEEQVAKLEEIAWFKKEDAKGQLLAEIEEKNQTEIINFIDKLKMIKKEEADKEAAQIIARVLPRISSDAVSEFTSTTVDIPSEDFKGKLIGREGRNINCFERTTGAEIIIDDTPLCVKVSCYEPEKRYLATETLKRLIKDGRINPHYIEKTYNDVSNSLDDMLSEKGKEALQMVNLPMMKPAIVRYIGQFFLRYSYGQNLRTHSIEVAKICEALATEMGLDPIMAKKAGMLHDIGKVIAATGESHTKIGADTLRKHAMHEIIVNAAESHHFDVPMTDTISWIVAAADAMSASRPWARYNTKELFIEKMGELEKLISEITGVQKVHIMQAWRDIMVFVDPASVDDLGTEKMLKTIAEKVEEQLDYPGIIRISAIRELKIVDFLR